MRSIQSSRCGSRLANAFPAHVLPVLNIAVRNVIFCAINFDRPANIKRVVSLLLNIVNIAIPNTLVGKKIYEYYEIHQRAGCYRIVVAWQTLQDWRSIMPVFEYQYLSLLPYKLEALLQAQLSSFICLVRLLIIISLRL
jgi:hypothetical protein